MKRYALIGLTLLLSLVIPVSVYAYNNLDNSSESTSVQGTYDIHEEHHQNDSNNMMNENMSHDHSHNMMTDENMSYDYMHNMMTNENMDCDNETEHNTHVDEQRNLIQQDLLDNKISQEVANQKLQDLNDMLDDHQDHQEDDSHMDSCHYSP
ncbi:hypothetical protein HLPCO_002690 [Haloplasma contractile SSD-17B]|uniref:Secreted protein n=1 Tax=Haloplasma contractile SSD-17B TaxID=1033810 RepID=F7PW92_9MOLU|nr:hypothetical protein [Haloplasma contractile]ERJ11250.1 hypothetical protein HLPCO_002690 [Haloplasma contractile SSD-17B]